MKTIDITINVIFRDRDHRNELFKEVKSYNFGEEFLVIRKTKDDQPCTIIIPTAVIQGIRVVEEVSQ